MTEDRINRDDCIAAIEAAPNADDAIALIRALPAADAGALGAVAMREACLDVYVKGDWDWFSDAHDAMAEIPVPTHAAQLAAAMKLPEVAAMVKAVKHLMRNYLQDEMDEPDLCVNDEHWTAIKDVNDALAALEVRHD